MSTDYEYAKREMIQIEGDQSQRKWIEDEIQMFLYVRMRDNTRKKNRIHKRDASFQYVSNQTEHENKSRRYYFNHSELDNEKKIGYFALMKNGQIHGEANGKYIEPIPFNFTKRVKPKQK